MYEFRRTPPLPRALFLWRVARHVGLAVLVVLGSLASGMIGFRCFENTSWSEAFLHAAVPLSGLGLAQIPGTPGGKIFAGLYALYAGLVFLVAAGIIFAPLVHRLLHLFHWSQEERAGSSQR